MTKKVSIHDKMSCFKPPRDMQLSALPLRRGSFIM